VPLPIRLVVVSCPATVSWKIVDRILLVQRVAFVGGAHQVGDQVLARLDAFAVEQLGQVVHDVR
jgi:hypothetical protein